MTESLALDVASTLDDLLGDRAPMETLLHAAAVEAPDPSLLAALRDIGIAELGVSEEEGGLSLDLDQLCLVSWVGGRRLMPTIGRLSMSLVGPMLAGTAVGQLDPSGWACSFPSISASGNRKDSAEVWLGEGAHRALVVSDHEALIVDLKASGTHIDPSPGIDPGQGCSVLVFDAESCERVTRSDHARIVDRARVLALAELSGVADRVTEVSLDYSLQRVQFGRPLAEFQVLQHLLADMRAGSELIRSAVSRLARLDEPQPRLTASLAVEATSLARSVVEKAIQIHGGMGYSWEYGLHLYYRRCLAVQRQLGGAESLRRFIGQSMVTTRRDQ